MGFSYWTVLVELFHSYHIHIAEDRVLLKGRKKEKNIICTQVKTHYASQICIWEGWWGHPPWRHESRFGWIGLHFYLCICWRRLYSCSRYYKIYIVNPLANTILFHLQSLLLIKFCLPWSFSFLFFHFELHMFNWSWLLLRADKLYKGTGPPASGLLVVALAHALALFSAVASSINISGGHVNPAVTFGSLVGGRISVIRAVSYWVAQLLGSIFAALLLRLVTNGMVRYMAYIFSTLWFLFDTFSVTGFPLFSVIHVCITRLLISADTSWIPCAIRGWRGAWASIGNGTDIWTGIHSVCNSYWSQKGKLGDHCTSSNWVRRWGKHLGWWSIWWSINEPSKSIWACSSWVEMEEPLDLLGWSFPWRRLGSPHLWVHCDFSRASSSPYSSASALGSWRLLVLFLNQICFMYCQ